MKVLLTHTTRSLHTSRILSSSTASSLKQRLKEVIPDKREKFTKIKMNYSDVKVGDITIGSVIGGMRGNQSMFWQGTSLDPEEGIRFQGLSIPECMDQMAGISEIHGGSKSLLPESMLWLLMTGELPTKEQTNSLSKELAERGKILPQSVNTIVSNLPKDMHPMTQLAIGLASLNQYSQFAKEYERGSIGKNDYWDFIYEDVLNLIASLPHLTGQIYANITNEGKPLGEFNENADWAYNISSLLGMTTEASSANKQNLSEKRAQDFADLVRLYTAIHVDHEGGNVSAHATHLVGSALGDPFISYASGIMGLAGPLHGLAAQEVVRFLVEMNASISSPENVPEIENYLWSILNSRRVVPGYGHAVLRKPDPRFNAMLNFAKERPDEFQSDKNVLLMENLSTIAPKVLQEHGKCKNPFPNVDSASGILFHHYGIQETLFFTVIFGCSRAIGSLTQLVWDRILGLPIERPRSLDMAALERLCNK
ncbi:Citrate synthase, C-terminal domain [Nakaseomyces glabratus]|nr:Citrate synthase, C-terminal domain [Nakaseomyces glabratus]KAH7595227.1 Citrate synthase, C-terminal domain [Nakaseomyces glabratus]KAH7611311.1 Citrate synthase, C-terminal domain [Nakaseomyces glabratus]